MNMFAAFWRSTIGKKVVMAVTGVLMIAFVIGHVSGNLLVFRGAETFNRYAALLKGLGGLLWAARLGLLAALMLHVTASYQLTRAAAAARPARYARREPQVSTWASRTMRWGGMLLFVFIGLHLAQFTFGWIDHATFSETDAYSNVMVGFRNPWWVLFYEVSMVALGFHLFHGAWASVRSLGVARPSGHPLHRRIATLIAVGVWLAFSIIPLGVYAGIAKPAAGPDTTVAAPAAATPASP